jgi:hypothetical protein
VSIKKVSIKKVSIKILTAGYDGIVDGCDNDRDLFKPSLCCENEKNMRLRTLTQVFKRLNFNSGVCSVLPAGG